MTIQLHGKEYIEVKDRVTMAHAQDSYSMLKEETFSLGGREYVRVFIDVKGKQYIGTAECKYNAPPKTPDGQSPFECGETSALGRALGFAGYGVVDSIASADEVASNQQQESAGRALHALTAPGSYEQHEANGHQSPALTLEAVQKRAVETGVAKTRAAWQIFNAETLAEFVPDEKLKNMPDELALLNDEITARVEAKASK